jgi:hypothetical protein
MKKYKLIPVLLALVLAFSTWMPALATSNVAANPASVNAAASGPINLTIKNPLPKATTVNLTGTKTYSIYVVAGGTVTKTIDAGKYKYSYAGCYGKAVKGNLQVKGTTSLLKIKPCKMANWSWTNPSSSSFVTIRLKGWVNYNVSISPGQTVKVSWVAGTYQITLKHCGKTYNDTLKVSGNKRWIFYPCK